MQNKKEGIYIILGVIGAIGGVVSTISFLLTLVILEAQIKQFKYINKHVNKDKNNDFDITQKQKIITEEQPPQQRTNSIKKEIIKIKPNYSLIASRDIKEIKEKIEEIIPKIPIIPNFIQPQEETSQAPQTYYKVAIIVDDVGHTPPNNIFTELINLDIPITFAIIPKLKYTIQMSQLANKYNKEVIVHMPLEPCGRSKNDREGSVAIFRGMGEEEVTRRTKEAIEAVPGAVGMNIHMGSLASADETIMLPLMKTIKEKNYFFVDSLTSPKSVAWKVAKQENIPWAKRDVFLDNKDDKEYIKKQIAYLIEVAKKKGEAIGICHMLRKELVVALREMLPEFEKNNIKLVKLSEIVNKNGE